MHKTLLLLSSILLLSFISLKEEPIDQLDVKGPLKFDNVNFKLAWAAHPKDAYYVQEYLPEAEKLANFNQMLTLNLFVTDIEVKDAVAQKTNELIKRKETDAMCNYKVNESPDGKEFIVDFLMGESKDNKMTVAEFNVYRYKQIELAAGKKAILVYAYSKRAYGNDITAFLNTLGENRMAYLNQMISTALPQIRIAKE